MIPIVPDEKRNLTNIVGLLDVLTTEKNANQCSTIIPKLKNVVCNIDDGRDGDYDANVCNGFFSRNYAALAKVTKFYAKILFYDEGQVIPQTIRSQFNHYSDHKWLDNSYHSLIKSYPALGQILEAVEVNRLKDWIRKGTTFMINKTMNEQRPNTVSIDTSMVPHLMTVEELCAKISSFKKVTYIALSAILPELIRSNAKPIGLYFDGAFRDRSWIGETYNNHPSVYNDLGIIMIGLSNNDQPLINGTDVFHCIKRCTDFDEDNINDNNIDDNSYAQINQMLLQHQHHITVAKLS
ncbi:unnamed protein product [Rhizophagus irregularis]|nr:unnamed protein product [Rhizophagus irregularis]